jgi:small conductance mechanosensitive channel
VRVRSARACHFSGKRTRVFAHAIPCTPRLLCAAITTLSLKWIEAMLLALIFPALLLGQIATSAPAPSAPPASQASTDDVAAAIVATETSAPTTAPTTQPTQVEPALPPQPAGTILDTFSNTRLGKLAQGKQQVNWQQLQEMAQPAFWFDTIKDLVLALIACIPRVLIATLFLLIFWVIYRGIRRVLLGSMKKAAVDESIRDLLGSLIKWSVMGFGLIIACNQIGIQITALLAGVSVLGLAIGFAAQETLSNFIAGIVIFWDKPFKLGDWVTVDGMFSQVQRVTFRSTRMLTLDGEVLVMPNTQMLANKLINHTTHPLQRVNIPIGIAYKESIDNARACLLGLVSGDSRICDDPRPEVIVTACADSSVNLMLRFWIRDESQERKMIYQYIEKAKKALDSAGIEIPFPHLQLFLEETSVTRSLTGGGRRAA